MHLAVSADSWYVIGSLPITTGVQVTLGHAAEENASFPQIVISHYSFWLGTDGGTHLANVPGPQACTALHFHTPVGTPWVL